MNENHIEKDTFIEWHGRKKVEAFKAFEDEEHRADKKGRV